MTALLNVHVEQKRYGERTVLDRIGFALQAGEIVSLLGPSGCGKSTLLRIIAGLEREFDGRLALAGQGYEGLNRGIGFIFQEPRLLPWLTVAENVAFDLGSGGANDPRVGELLAEVGLTGLNNALPKQLSGGQAQRVAIARGLFRHPQVLLLDEPFSAVDAFTRMRLQDLLLEVAKQHGTTVLLVTHDPDEALYLSDRVLVMSQSGIDVELEVPLARPRDRRHPALSELKNAALTALFAAHAI
ncbi:ABC transporter ATP-binding protein [Chitinimonas sp.]|uniref:ABC transporter ATP-binding protein n=1 Tax=Chitinimonas sp. TaxID=1934313 RepID=UPI002F946F07